MGLQGRAAGTYRPASWLTSSLQAGGFGRPLTKLMENAMTKHVKMWCADRQITADVHPDEVENYRSGGYEIVQGHKDQEDEKEQGQQEVAKPRRGRPPKSGY